MSDIPPGFGPPPRSSNYLNLIGPFHFKPGPQGPVVGFRVEEKHLNTRDLAQGGLLVTLVDIAMGYTLAFAVDPPMPLVTASLTTDFVGSARLGDWVEAHTSVIRRGSLSFAECRLLANGATIARASGIFRATKTVRG